MTRVFITGLGVVSPVGIGVDAFGAALEAGQTGAAEIAHFDHSAFERHIACEVKGFRPRDHLTAAETRRAGRCSAMALAAARMAVEHSGLSPERLQGERTGVIIGTTMGEADVLGELESAWLHQGNHAIEAVKIPRYGTTLLPIHVARAVGARGMVQTLPAACAAGNYAIGFAADQIRAGRADVMLTGASEVIEKLQFAGFVRLGAVSPDCVRPFDVGRKGLLVGEGAGMVVLESEAHLVRRGGVPIAEVGGYGLACDAHHITRPHPDGEGSLHAMREAIRTSGLLPEQVDFINAHGTGTHANDRVEAKVIAEIFGSHRPAVTSIKSMLGHCMGAASAIEAVSCVLSITRGLLPPTINIEEVDADCAHLDLVLDRTREGRADVVLNNSLAFGGYDAVLALAKPGLLPDPAEVLA
ncbi:MAG: beta-ketoacyl-[acyl-carrier-protein] synthase family protein [Myxococcales bacterium]|nr:beta-ketoacyl-[acyl-carrier-protein] synthase family protein [Myxococcales bacterium]